LHHEEALEAGGERVWVKSNYEIAAEREKMRRGKGK